MTFIPLAPATRRTASLTLPAVIAARLRELRAYLAGRRALRSLRAHDLRDIGLDRPDHVSLTPSFDAADRLSIRTNGGAGFYR